MHDTQGPGRDMDNQPVKKSRDRRHERVRYKMRDPLRYIYLKTRRRARERGIAFDIAQRDLVMPTMCPVLGIPITPTGGPGSPSIDRINPLLGYTKGNVRIISWRANWLKNNATTAESLRLAADALDLERKGR